MIKIPFIPPEDKKWDEWRKKCAEETLVAIQSAEAKSVYHVKDLYKDAYIKRTYYFNDGYSPFYRKCAYCETELVGVSGDLDHYRPKAGVRDAQKHEVPNHIGYYWLTYSWENLLPCCEKCNRPNKWYDSLNQEFNLGKIEYFPLVDEDHRAFTHTYDLALEQPLFINPLLEDPEEHLEVDVKTGLMSWKTPRGEFCVDIFGLNSRSPLVKGRIRTMGYINSLLTDYFSNVRSGNKNLIVNSLTDLLSCANGKINYSLAARCYLKEALGLDYIMRIEKLLEHWS